MFSQLQAQAHEAQTQDNTINSNTFESIFRFRRIKPSALDSIVQASDLDETTLRNMFAEDTEKNEDGELVPTGWVRRKEEKHQLELPTWLPNVLELLPEQEAKHLENVIQRHIEDFVKSEFVDNYLPIGEHSWETIAKKAATSSRRGSFTIDAETYKDAVASIVSYIVQVTAAPQLKPHMQKALDGKFSRAAIQRNVGNVDAELIGKLKAHLDGWATFMSENNPQLANEYAEVYEYLHGRLDALLGGSSIDVAGML